VSGLVVTGWSAVCSAGVGAGALAGRLAGADLATAPVDSGVPVGHLYAEPLPDPTGHALVDFDVREYLGRKGTSVYDRATALAVVCCQDALRAAGTTVDDTTRTRTGVAFGTSLGSFKSTSDFSRDTLVQEKPYLVNPVRFPNTVMNCAAGQVAIRFGLRGINATIAGGTLAFLNAVRYAGNAIERGYVDAVLTGAVEEYTPHRAWAGHLTGATGVVASGEAAAVFVLADPGAPGWTGAGRAARILAVCTGYGPGGGEVAERVLESCVHRALRRATVDPGSIAIVVTGESDETDRREYRPVVRALGHQAVRVQPKRLFGECDAASGALALAVLLAAAGTGGLPDGLALITGRGVDGAVGAAIVEVYPGAGADRG
jgi:3-oxoacyl-[acyl-carrier-protein] synthase II